MCLRGLAQISCQARHFRKVRYRLHARRAPLLRSGTDFVAGAFARSGTNCVAGATLSQGQVQIVAGALAQGPVQISWEAQHAFASSATDFVAGAARSKGQAQVSWQAQHFRFKFRGTRVCAGLRGFRWQAQHFRKGKVQISYRRSTCARSGTDYARFPKVRYRFRDRRSTFARAGTDFVASAALSQGQVRISWQAQHFRKVRHRFLAGAALS